MQEIMNGLSMLQGIGSYSQESCHGYVNLIVFLLRNRRRRAKALLDFERHDDDELGFRKNDIVTVRFTFVYLIILFLIAIG